MKFRGGFVSNSSSSSFVVFGICASIDELVEKYGMLQEHADYIRADHYDAEEKLNIGVIKDYDSGIVYIGEDPDNMTMDETKRQFQERTKAQLKKLLPNLNDTDIELHVFEIHD